MDKQRFLNAIQEKLSGLPENDVNKALDYYREMIEDSVEDGMTEEEAVAAMGTVDEIAERILMETPLPRLMKAKVSASRGLRGWEILLLLLGLPIWGSLLLAAVIIVLAVYIVIWSVVLVLYAVVFSLGAGTLAGIAAGIILAITGGGTQALMLAGVGLLCAGAAILFCLAFNRITWCIFQLSKKIIKGIKRIFVRKES